MNRRAFFVVAAGMIPVAALARETEPGDGVFLPYQSRERMWQEAEKMVTFNVTSPPGFRSVHDTVAGPNGIEHHIYFWDV